MNELFQSVTTNTESLEQMGAVDSGTAERLQSLAGYYEPQAEASLSVGDARTILALAEQLRPSLNLL